MNVEDAKSQLRSLEIHYARSLSAQDQLMREMENSEEQIRVLEEFFDAQAIYDKDHPMTWKNAAAFMKILLIQIGNQRAARNIEEAKFLISEMEQNND